MKVQYIYLHNFSKIKSQKKSQNSRNQGFSYYFCCRLADPDLNLGGPKTHRSDRSGSETLLVPVKFVSYGTHWYLLYPHSFSYRAELYCSLKLTVFQDPKVLVNILSLCGPEACKNVSDVGYLLFYLWFPLNYWYRYRTVLSNSPNAYRNPFPILSFLIYQYSTVPNSLWLPTRRRNLPE